MGKINPDVENGYLSTYQEEKSLLFPFLDFFSVLSAERLKKFKVELSIYLLESEPTVMKEYGFGQQMLLIYLPNEKIDSSAIEVIESMLSKESISSPLDKINYFLVSEDDEVLERVQSYVRGKESSIAISFTAKQIGSWDRKTQIIQQAIESQLYQRDLFDFRLPLETNKFFFGREKIISKSVDAVKRGENIGLFGLRKTGKTSLLFQIEKVIEDNGLGTLFYYDCKSPSVRKLRWFELLERICKDLSDKFSISAEGRYDEINVTDTFSSVVEKCGANESIILTFDEIEYVSFLTPMDIHWHQDFIDFWQAFWACQSRHKKNISLIVLGVNPSVVEYSTVKKTQNPLFGIVSSQFIQCLTLEEVEKMVNTLGKRIGLLFESESIKYLYDRYGGHPLLVRMACSLINSQLFLENVSRPVQIKTKDLRANENRRDSKLAFYSKHVVSELNQFYPEEYIMLELLASGQMKSFLSRAKNPESVRHLEAYGLLAYDKKLPFIPINVIQRHVGLELAFRENRKTVYKVIEPQERDKWLKEHVKAIINDLRELERQIQLSQSKPTIFGPNSFPEADRFVEIQICQSVNDFDAFINTCHRCFVESINVYGRHIQDKNYFHVTVKLNYPDLWGALTRIKLYRHNFMHLELYPKVDLEFLKLLKQDLENSKPSEVEDLYFVLQQCVLDGLYRGIQSEFNKLT